MSEINALYNQRIENVKSAITPTFKKLSQTNDLAYYEIDWKKFRPMGDRVLVEWEFAADEMTSGKITLLRPEAHKKMKYTGIVRKVGPKVEAPEIQPGVRILFDQFSNFEKFFDPELGRMALISERQQASAFAIIPHRVKIGEGQGDYNYDK